MTLKKKILNEGEILIYDEAVIYKRGDIWQFRLWLTKEHRYARLSLRTKKESIAIEKAQEHFVTIRSQIAGGKTYYSLTTKAGVEMYLEYRKGHIGRETTKGIVKGRYGTIKTHLEHWLNFIGKDVKLKELEKDDCLEYALEREKPNSKNPISLSTIMNEQSTINAMMKWLHGKGETYIPAFEFETISKKNKTEEDVGRSSFTDQEVSDIRLLIPDYIKEAKKDMTNLANRSKVLAGYYLLIASISGLRTGEQKQLTWKDIKFEQIKKGGVSIDVVNIRVRKETSKVRKTRDFFVRDKEYFDDLFKLTVPTHTKKPYANNYVFSYDGETVVSQRAILYHFSKLLKEADIQTKNRDLVPYSFRHYFITHRIKSGLSYKDIADMCGTSTTQIEKTYYHIDRDIKITQALADYIVTDEGIIVPQ
jgi:integrase